MVRYYGCFAPRSKWRKLVVPGRATEESGEKSDDCCSARRRQSWAQLMKRVFAIDVLECPRCGSQMQRVEFVLEGPKIRALLDSVGYAADSPESEVTESV